MSEKLSEDDAAMAELQQKLDNARREQCLVDPPDPKPLSPRPVAVISDEEQSRRDAKQKKREADRVELVRRERWGSFIAQVGRRYADCFLENFQATTDQQCEVVAALQVYKSEIRERVKTGVNLILFGPKGTGKDHLLVAMARTVINEGANLQWWNGMDLFGEVRDRIGKEQSEREFIRQLAEPHVLYISDPLPPVGSLTEFQVQTLFRILDARYRHVRPVWCSVNVSGPEEAEQRLGPQNADRLRDGALALYCNWPSYRKVVS